MVHLDSFTIMSVEQFIRDVESSCINNNDGDAYFCKPVSKLNKNSEYVTTWVQGDPIDCDEIKVDIKNWPLVMFFSK